MTVVMNIVIYWLYERSVRTSSHDYTFTVHCIRS